MTDRCESLFLHDQVGDSATAWYYRCVLSPGHGPRHRGHRVDELGRDVDDGRSQTWSDSLALNHLDDSDLHEHPQDPNQMTFDLETLT